MGALGSGASNLGGDIGMSNWPIVGGMFSNPVDRQKVSNLQDMSTQSQWRRPIQAQSYMNALQNRSDAYKGAGDALASMYGQGAGRRPDVSKNPGQYVGPGGVKDLFAPAGVSYGDDWGYGKNATDKQVDKLFNK